MSIAYIHINDTSEPKRTLAVQIPDFTAAQAIALAYMFNPTSNPIIVNMEFGKATLHPEDRYVKRIGREIAKANMKSTDLHVVGVKRIHNSGNPFIEILLEHEEELICMELYTTNNKVFFARY